MGKDAALAPLERATSLLAQCRTVSDAVDIRDKARAAEVYAKQARLGLEAQNHAAEIKIRAERKAGELLAAMNNHGGDRKSESRSHNETLNDMGISKTQSHRWQKIATVPEQAFKDLVDDANENGKELTSAAVSRCAQSAAKPNNGKSVVEKSGSIAALLLQLDSAIRGEFKKWAPGSSAVFCDRLRSLADQINDTGGLPE